ncbi:unnamed protein product [Closterium sp. Naga37s-1]|nr:unnamed protein product [Closterium sp. Naga37s-1]
MLVFPISFIAVGRDCCGAQWWEKSDWTGYKELGAEKSGRNDQGDSWWEKYNGKGWTEKGSHKYGRSNDQSWWEKWGEQYDGQGMVLKWTDKWAEKDDGTKWGDKWEERFTSGVGHRQGETWHVENSGSRWSRTWGEEHFGDGGDSVPDGAVRAARDAIQAQLDRLSLSLQHHSPVPTCMFAADLTIMPPNTATWNLNSTQARAKLIKYLKHCDALAAGDSASAARLFSPRATIMPPDQPERQFQFSFQLQQYLQPLASLHLRFSFHIEEVVKIFTPKDTLGAEAAVDALSDAATQADKALSRGQFTATNTSGSVWGGVQWEERGTKGAGGGSRELHWWVPGHSA